MSKLKIFTAPKDYSDYTFWRSEHQRFAIWVMFGAAVYAIARWLF